MWWFKKKKKHYPSKYFEWVDEFKKLSATLLDAANSSMLSEGILLDEKVCLDSFKRELVAFLDKQVGLLVTKYIKEIQAQVEDGCCEYLLLVVRRNNMQCNNLFFFKQLPFLDEEYKNKLVSEIHGKIQKINSDLLQYVKKLDVVPSYAQVEIVLQRIMNS